MKTVWKYPLKHHLTVIEMPLGAQILYAQMQNGSPMLWALVNPNDYATTHRSITIYGTGHDIPHHPGRYINTFMENESMLGTLVWHAFDTTNL